MDRTERASYRLRIEACKIRREELIRFLEWYNEYNADDFHMLIEQDVDEYIEDEYHVSKHEMGV